MNDKNAGRMLLVREAAKKLRVSRNTMAKLIREGRVPSVVLLESSSRRLVRIPEAALERYLFEQASLVQRVRSSAPVQSPPNSDRRAPR
jgi:excisionase family DNA binding protein